MGVTDKRLDGENIGLELDGGTLTVDVFSCDLTTGALASSYLTADDLDFLAGGVAELFSLVPFAARVAAGAPLRFLNKLVQVSPADGSTMAISAPLLAGTTYALRATVGASPAYLVAHISHSIVGALTWVGDGTGGGGGGGAPPVGPAGGVLGYVEPDGVTNPSFYPNPSGLAGIDNGTGFVFNVPVKSPTPGASGAPVPPAVVIGFTAPEVPGEYGPQLSFVTSDGGTDTNPVANIAAPNGGSFTVELGDGTPAIKSPNAGAGGGFSFIAGEGGAAVDGGGLAPANGSFAGWGGPFLVTTGNGGDGASDEDTNGGSGGRWRATLGNGGNPILPSKAKGGDGGYFEVVAGDGGQSPDTDYNPGLNRKDAGIAGFFSFHAGSGGSANDNAPLSLPPFSAGGVSNKGEATDGGGFEVVCGGGGLGANNQDGAKGGSLDFIPGDGGDIPPPPYTSAPIPQRGEVGRTRLHKITSLFFDPLVDSRTVADGDTIGQFKTTFLPLLPDPLTTPNPPGPRQTIRLAKAANPANPDLFATATRSFFDMARNLTPGDLLILAHSGPPDTIVDVPPPTITSYASYIEMQSDDSVHFGSGGTVTLKPGDTVTLVFNKAFGKWVEVARSIA